MDSAIDLLSTGNVDDMIELLDIASSGSDISVKIDGAPAIVMWSEFPGLKGPGVSYKLIIQQTQKGTPGVYFTTDKEIEEHFNSKNLDSATKQHRIDSFKNALKLAKTVRPNIMLWGDTFYGSSKELSSVGGCPACQPNTLQYIFTDKSYISQIRKSEFGIFIHTIADKNCNTKRVSSVSNLVDTSKAFILDPNDTKPTTKRVTVSKDIKELSANLNTINELRDQKFLKLFRKSLKIKDFDYMSKLYPVATKTLLDSITVLNEIQTKIINTIRSAGFYTQYEGEESGGEGFVVSTETKAMKLLVDDFYEKNIKHIRSLKECLLDSLHTYR